MCICNNYDNFPFNLFFFTVYLCFKKFMKKLNDQHLLYFNLPNRNNRQDDYHNLHELHDVLRCLRQAQSLCTNWLCKPCS